MIRLSYPTRTNPSPVKHIIGRLSSAPTALFVAPSSIYLIALAGNKAYTYLLPSAFPPSASSSSVGPSVAAAEDKSPMPQCVKFVSDNSLTCGAFAPADKLAIHGGKGKASEDWFATGDERGVIRLWHGLGRAFALLNNSSSGAAGTSEQVQGAERRLPTTSLHWHAHAVAALAFTPGGSQLLSVGEESVLVQWHLASGKREYIPRLGGRPIVSLAVKEGKRGQEEEWYVALQDGSRMKVGAASGNISPVGQGVRLGKWTILLARQNAGLYLDIHPVQGYPLFAIWHQVISYRYDTTEITSLTPRPPNIHLPPNSLPPHPAPLHLIPRPPLLPPVHYPIHRPRPVDRPVRPRSRAFQPRQPAGRQRARGRRGGACGI